MLKIIHAISILPAIASCSPCQCPMPDFFNQLYESHGSDYRKMKSDEYESLCQSQLLNLSDRINQENFYRIHFLHDLFTGAGASNFAAGGVLEIPYLWHWMEPNPRHSIVSLPDSVPLSTLKPPAEFSRYKTFADIDRVPSLYLGDLVSESPRYFHPDFGEFHTFGWCSEREMAFALLLSFRDYDGKIVQSEIHTWSELWIPFTGTDGSSMNLCAKVDNTFDSVTWAIIPKNTDKECLAPGVRFGGSGSMVQ